jgi:hypothetical protein
VLDLFEEFKSIITALERMGIDYAVCDGLIALKSLRGSGQDMDDINKLREN